MCLCRHVKSNRKREAAAELHSLLCLATLISNDCLAAFIQDIDEQWALI